MGIEQCWINYEANEARAPGPEYSGNLKGPAKIYMKFYVIFLRFLLLLLCVFVVLLVLKFWVLFLSLFYFCKRVFLSIYSLFLGVLCSWYVLVPFIRQSGTL